MHKTPEQLAIQKAIVCMYLRKRHARFWWRFALDNWRNHSPDVAKQLEVERYVAYNEACNNLTILKRVLYHNVWN